MSQGLQFLLYQTAMGVPLAERWFCPTPPNLVGTTGLDAGMLWGLQGFGLLVLCRMLFGGFGGGRGGRAAAPTSLGRRALTYSDSTASNTLALRNSSPSSSSRLVGRSSINTLPRKKPGIAMRGGRIYVCDSRGDSLTVLDLEKREMRLIGVTGFNRLSNPVDVELADDGMIYVADRARGVVVYGPDERPVRVFPLPESRPAALAVYGDRLYVAGFDGGPVDGDEWTRRSLPLLAIDVHDGQVTGLLADAHLIAGPTDRELYAWILSPPLPMGESGPRTLLRLDPVTLTVRAERTFREGREAITQLLIVPSASSSRR